jgi:hypothetical protein
MTITQEIWLVSTELASRASQSRYALATNRAERWARIFAERYGVEGEEVSSLKGVGDRHDLTRERVRQITSKVLAHATSLSVPTPCLDQLGPAIARHTPAKVEELNEKLRDLLGPLLSVRDAQRFAAEVMGKKVAHLVPSPFKQGPSRPQIAVDAESPILRVQIRRVRSCALKMIRTAGAAQIHFVTGSASAELEQPLSAQEVQRWCVAAPGFEWLDEKTGWFWLGPDHENRLFSVVKKQLVAARGRLDISEVHAGMSVSNRLIYKENRESNNFIEAPAIILAEVFSRLSWVKLIQHNDVLLVGEIEEKEVLSDVERAIVELIRSRHNVVSKAEIDQHIAALALAGPMGVAMGLSRSPIFTKLGRGLYAIRGTTIDPQGLANALQRVGGDSRGTVITAYHDDGTLLWPVRISESAYKHRPRVHVPAMLAKSIEPGAYQLLKPRGNVRIHIPEDLSNAYARGIMGPLVRAGFLPGQTVNLLLDPAKKTLAIAPDSKPGAGTVSPG